MLPPERPGRAAPPDLAARREGLETAIDAGLWRTDPPPVETRPGGVRALQFDPPGGEVPRATLLHLHGGAFRIGAPEQIAPFAAALAARARVRVVCPAYRLAPEHPFPAGLADALAAVAALVAEGSAPLVLSGDSAGGGLAASLAALARDRGIAPAALLLFSPWLDLSATDPAYQAHAATDPLFSRAAAVEAADAYLQGHDPADPLASPLGGTLAGLPPVFVSAGGGEVLVGDARRLAAGLEAAGTPVRLSLVDGMDHVAVTRGFDLPGAAETFEAAVAFLDERLPPPA